jgi:hypothetical protein
MVGLVGRIFPCGRNNNSYMAEKEKGVTCSQKS